MTGAGVDDDAVFPRRAAAIATAVSVVVFLLVATYGRPWSLFERGPYTSDFFDEQAHALLHGHLSVDPAVASLEGFRHGGKTYFYFGIVPSLFRLPVAAVTSALDGRLSLLSMAVAVAVACWSAGRIVWWARRRARPGEAHDRSDTVMVAGFVLALGLSSPVLFLAARGLVYHEAIAWGIALSLFAFHRALVWWHDPTTVAFVVAVLAATGAMNSRSSVGAAGALTLAGLVVAHLVTRRHRWRREWLRGLVLLAAAALPFLLFMAVNEARFGDPVRIPFAAQGINSFDPHRAVVLRDNGGTIVGSQFVSTTALDYLRPDGIRLQSLFPWITFRRSTHVFGGVTFDAIDRASSVPAEAPLWCVAAAVGLVAMVRRRRGTLPWWIGTVAGAVAVVPTLAIGFIANRYLGDFVPLLVVPGAVGVWSIRGALVNRGGAIRRGGAAAVVVLGVAGFLVVLALTVQSSRLYLVPKDADRLAFVGLQYDLDSHLGGGPPPYVGQGPVLPATGHDRDVFIVGQCDALDWNDGTGWFQLEHAPDATPLCDRLLARLHPGVSPP